MHKNFLTLLCTVIICVVAKANLESDLQQLQAAYPLTIKSVSKNTLTWTDGTQWLVENQIHNKFIEQKLIAPSLADQITNIHYPKGKLTNTELSKIVDDPGRIRYEPFFKKMYGRSKSEVKKNLVTIYWMPKIFNKSYPLQVTTINNVDKKLILVSEALEKLPPRYYKYLDKPLGTFCSRTIANTHRLSPHSFGMTIDINRDYSDYWQWDLEREGSLISEDALLVYHNEIPPEIVNIFEQYGFIWGGKWHHYDTMHFEYRPELLM